MDNPELEDQVKDGLDQFKEAKHREGASYWLILGILLETTRTCFMQAEAEYWLKQK